ncbi:MAG: replicative DNA helicase [Bacteroidota bacterium]
MEQNKKRAFNNNWQKPPANQMISAENGKLPPQNVELEETVLGAMLLENEAVEEVIGILHEECFYKTQNMLIYQAMDRLYKKSETIDILTVSKELKAMGELETVGGTYYVSSLTNRIASSASIVFHARIIMQSYLKRNLIRISTENIRNAYDDTTDVFEIYGTAATNIDAALTSVMRFDARKIGDVHAELIIEGMNVLEGGKNSGVPSFFKGLDKITNGWQKTDLVILAGRPGMGKTTCAVALAIRPAIIEKTPIAIYSLEMSTKQLVGRIQATLSGVNSSKIIKKQFTKDENKKVDDACQMLYDTPVFIDDTPNISLVQLKAKLRRQVAKQGVKLAVIDYLQLMSSGLDIQHREQEVSTIARGLKNLAKELDIPIIALSQLSRGVEKTGDKKPQLSDLRESGEIEQSADMVMFCYRPSYYGITEYILEDNTVIREEGCKEMLELIIAKHRNGELGSAYLGFIADLTKVTDWDWSAGRAKNVLIQTEINYYRNLENPENNSTFVQQTTQLSENTDFLAQKKVDNNDNGDSTPF